MYNETFDITPAMVFDEDGDEVSVWYDWGDDTELSAGDPEAAYEGTHVYAVTGNVTLTAYADETESQDTTCRRQPQSPSAPTGSPSWTH